MTTLVLATHNEHKVVELRQILEHTMGAAGVEVVSASAFPDVSEPRETEVSFVGNARLKAAALAQATGTPAVGDDSGLSVDVLGGAPGIFSARWSGAAYASRPRSERDAANLQLLLDQLDDVPDAHRGAAFRCAAVLVMPDGREAVAEGEVRGQVVRMPRGDNGFGYDPIFVPDGDTRTLAEYSDAEKNAISHRGRAFRALAPALGEHLAD